MRILIVTPAPRGSRVGNRMTANRWARLIRKLGHKVQVSDAFVDQKCDLMVAIHARKTADDIVRFRQHNPDRPIVLLLAGTDLYRDIHTVEKAQRSLEIADRLIVLQSEGKNELRAQHRSKCDVIYQSTPPCRRGKPLSRCFEICVIGHLRSVKDPFRAALAARDLPAASAIRVVHLGRALSDSMATRARSEMKRNARYRWLGEVPAWKARNYLMRSRAMVISSKLEGGANVVSDAVVGGVPILASKISGTIGQLGKDYAGYFPVGDTSALTELMHRSETDRRFIQKLETQIKNRRPLYTQRRELASLRTLLSSIE